MKKKSKKKAIKDIYKQIHAQWDFIRDLALTPQKAEEIKALEGRIVSLEHFRYCELNRQLKDENTQESTRK